MRKLLTVIIALLLACTLVACVEPAQKQNYGTYVGALANDKITIDNKSFVWEDKSYTYTVVDDKISIKGYFADGKTSVDFYVFENFSILSAGKILSFSQGAFPQRDNGIDVRLDNLDENNNPIESYIFDVNGSFNFINANNTELNISGTYTFKDGLLIMNSSNNISGADKAYWYISTDGKIHDGVYVKDISRFIHINNSYTLKYIAGFNGTLSGNANQTITADKIGENVTAVPNEGYIFDIWSDGVALATRNDFGKNIIVTATFKPINYDIKYQFDSTNGKIIGECNQSVYYGENATSVTAVPLRGYKFIGWSDGVSTATRQDKNIVRNLEIEANFSKLTGLNVVYSAGENGTILGDNIQTIYEGETTSAVKAVANEGYEFESWSDGVKTATRQDAYANEDIIVFANFNKLSSNFTITYLADKNGTISGDSIQTIYEGETTSAVKAVANEGYEFVSWSDGVKTATRQDAYANEDIIVFANFNKLSSNFTITYLVDKNGTISGDSIQTIYEGETTSAVKAVANEGYEFESWSDGVKTATRQDDSLTSDVTVTAIFKEIGLDNLTEFAGGNGNENNPFKVETPQHIINIDNYPNAYFIVINDIELPTVERGQSNHKPLFDETTMFGGHFDGNGKTISNLTIYNSTTSYSGLFACIAKSGSVVNLKLDKVSIDGTNYVGGIAGYSLGAILDCEVVGIGIRQAKDINDKEMFIGGIVGKSEGLINNCKTKIYVFVELSKGKVNAGGIVGYYDCPSTNELVLIAESEVKVNSVIKAYVGGLIGYNNSNITINNSYSTGKVEIFSVTHYSNSLGVGGLIGYNASNNININNSYNTGDLTVKTENTSTCVGGLIGNSYGINTNISNSYNAGKISSIASRATLSYAGGLIGRGSYITDIINSYNKGEISSSGGYPYVGGLIGYGNKINISESYNNGYVGMENSATTIQSYVGGLVGVVDNEIIINNCYNNGNLSVKSSSKDTCILGGLVGFNNGEIIISNSYTTSKIYKNGVVNNMFGAIVGSAKSVKLTNVHWLYYADSKVEYAVANFDTTDTSINFGDSKHNDISEFYTLADKLNEGQDELVWENVTDSALPTLINKIKA